MIKKLRIVFEYALDIFAGLCFGVAGFFLAIFVTAYFGWQSLGSLLFACFIAFCSASGGIMFSLVMRAIRDIDD